MTKDKQIIIDGCDVSGCDFLAKEDDYSSYSGVTYAYKGQCMCSDEEMCKEHPKCFYKKVLKQLKRKEQECEELRENLPNAITRLMGELEQLEEQLEAYKMEAEEGKEINAELKAENEILEKVNKANQEKIKKLNEKLEEEFIAKQYGDEALFFTLMNIKEICNNNDELKGDFNLVDCDKYKLGKHNLAKKILEEIKVVIDE